MSLEELEVRGETEEIIYRGIKFSIPCLIHESEGGPEFRLHQAYEGFGGEKLFIKKETDENFEVDWEFFFHGKNTSKIYMGDNHVRLLLWARVLSRKKEDGWLILEHWWEIQNPALHLVKEPKNFFFTEERFAKSYVVVLAKRTGRAYRKIQISHYELVLPPEYDD